MRFNEADQTYELSSGRHLYANCGVLGLPPSTDALYEGYDSGAGVRWDSNEEPPPLTPDEREEIATEMIRRWRAWASQAQEDVATTSTSWQSTGSVDRVEPIIPWKDSRGDIVFMETMETKEKIQTVTIMHEYGKKETIQLMAGERATFESRLDGAKNIWFGARHFYMSPRFGYSP